METAECTKPVWQRWTAKERKACPPMPRTTVTFSTPRTERLANREIIRQAKKAGFRPLSAYRKLRLGRQSLSRSQRKVRDSFSPSSAKKICVWLKLVGLHIDSLRLDLKVNLPTKKTAWSFPDALLRRHQKNTNGCAARWPWSVSSSAKTAV